MRDEPIKCRNKHFTINALSLPKDFLKMNECHSEKKMSKNALVLFLDLIFLHSILSIFVVGGLMSYVVGLPNNSYKSITNTAWVRAGLCRLQKM